FERDRAHRRDGRMTHLGGGIRDGERHRRRTEEGIAPAIHRHRAGVIGLATHRDLEVGGPCDRRNDADSRSVVFEDGSLLDMELDEDVEVTADSGGSRDRKSTRLNSSHRTISYAVFCLKKKILLTSL